jgi:phosphatidylinositol 3-kinase
LSAFRKKFAYNNLPEDTDFFDPLQLIPFLDYENENDNPVEDKYRALAHDLLRGLVDPALKPDREQRNRLANIIDSPSHHPTREEKDLLWRFRFSLVDNRRALTKFLLAVDWTMESEVVQAAELLEQWRRRSPIEVTDALKLLGKNVAFQTNLVRDYAIDTLAAAPDSELRLYLLQLVQALKYENAQRAETSRAQVSAGTNVVSSVLESFEPVSSLAAFLINRAAGNIELANYLYWYVNHRSSKIVVFWYLSRAESFTGT